MAKRGRECIETVPQRDNSNGVVKIERGRGIRRKRVREKDEGEGRVLRVTGDKRAAMTARERKRSEMKCGKCKGGDKSMQ